MGKNLNTNHAKHCRAYSMKRKRVEHPAETKIKRNAMRRYEEGKTIHPADVRIVNSLVERAKRVFAMGLDKQ